MLLNSRFMSKHMQTNRASHLPDMPLIMPLVRPARRTTLIKLAAVINIYEV